MTPTQCEAFGLWVAYKIRRTLQIYAVRTFRFRHLLYWWDTIVDGDVQDLPNPRLRAFLNSTRRLFQQFRSVPQLRNQIIAIIRWEDNFESTYIRFRIDMEWFGRGLWVFHRRSRLVHTYLAYGCRASEQMLEDSFIANVIDSTRGSDR